jgi:hypothetical protein
MPNEEHAWGRAHGAFPSDPVENAESARRSCGRTRYGGPWASAASSLPIRGHLTHPRPLARFITASAWRPRRLAALILLLLRTPSVHVVLSGSPAGQALDEYFKRRVLGILPNTRFCRGILLLPREHADYLRGQRRQALRTNLRRAASSGIRCEVVSDPKLAGDEFHRVIRRRAASLTEADLQTWVNDVRRAVTRSELTIAVARDESGRPLATAAVVIDDTVCLIKHALATNHEARWALHDHVVRMLIARRVRYLLAEGGGPFGALGFTSNVRHFQHLLGYELRHVIPVENAEVRRRKISVPSLGLSRSRSHS